MRAVIFDMDGLMIDSERLYFQAERDLANRFGREVREETLWRMMGRNPQESLAVFVKETDLPIDILEALRMRNEIMREKLKRDLQPMPGLEYIIAEFYGRLKLAVCTGAQKEFLDLVVDRLNIRNRFDVLQHSDAVGRGKPHPEIYLTTCRKLRLKPGSCIVLEDSSNGARAGKAAGCYVIAVPSEYTRRQDFSCADRIVKDLFAAADHILSLPGV